MTTVQDCVSTFISVKPATEYFWRGTRHVNAWKHGTSGWFPAVFVISKNMIFVRQVVVLCLNLTWRLAKHCQNWKLNQRKHSCNIRTYTCYIYTGIHSGWLGWECSHIFFFLYGTPMTPCIKACSNNGLNGKGNGPFHSLMNNLYTEKEKLPCWWWKHPIQSPFHPAARD